MKHIRKIKDYSVIGSMAAVLVVGLTGCEAPSNGDFQNTSGINQNLEEGAFVVIEEIKENQYKIAEEHPSSRTTILLRKLDGSERILSKTELDALIKEESLKIDNGTSKLTSSEVSSGNGGMSMGETILASMAGAMLGSWIGSKLFNNQNYQNNRKASYKSPSGYARSKNSFNQAKKANARKKSNFAKKSSSGMSKKRRGGFFGRSGGSRRFGG